MYIDFKLPIGNRAQVNSVTLESNGKVDPQEGNPAKEGIVDILDRRVESFVRSLDVKDLGAAWKNVFEPDVGEFTAALSSQTGARVVTPGDSHPQPSSAGQPVTSIGGQFLVVDSKTHTVTVQTQDVKAPFFNHWIEANYDPQSGKVNPETINEWVSS